jgi:hypothetical protein
MVRLVGIETLSTSSGTSIRHWNGAHRATSARQWDSGGGRYNGLVVALLILVGVMGAWIMFDSLSTKAPPPSPAKSAPAGEKLADRIQSGMDARSAPSAPTKMPRRHAPG